MRTEKMRDTQMDRLRKQITGCTLTLLFGAACTSALYAAPFGPGLVSLVAQGGAGGDTVLDNPTECFSVRFAALKSGPLTDFAFASTASRGFGNREPNAFIAELYADNAGKPGTKLGSATEISFNTQGGGVRAAKFAGLPVTARQVYHVVIRSDPANPVSGARNFAVSGYNLIKEDTPRLDSFDMSTPNPGYGYLHSLDGGATWTVTSNVVAAHTVTIGGAKQGWSYTANSDDLTAFKTPTQSQYIAQSFTYQGTDGDAGWLAVALRPQNGLANQEVKILFRIAVASDFSTVTEKTQTIQFGSAANAQNVAMDFSGTQLKPGEKYVFFAGLADAVSQTPDDYFFVRAYAAGPGASLDYDWQGPGTTNGGTRGWLSPDMKSVSASGVKGAAPRTVAAQVDIGLIIGATAAVATPPRGAMPARPTVAVSKRGLKICVAADAPEPVRRAAEAVLAAAPKHTLLSVMTDNQPVGALADTKALLAGKPEERALHHLVLVGLPTDPLISAAWQHEARLEDGGMYIFGWGHLRGDIGYIESDRNPFLHSAGIASAPYEAEIVTISGNTPAGITLAADAFLKQGLTNGVVAAPGWTRPQTTILDRDPLPANFTAPAEIPAMAGQMPLIGLTPGGEDEFRGVLEDAGTEPTQIWRAKYFARNAWNGAGAASAFDAYSAGLHRRAYGNTLWVASFASAQQAALVAPKIAAAAKLNKAGTSWTGNQPPYANGTYVGERPSSGNLRLWQQDNRVLMSTLPLAETNAVIAEAGK